MTGGALIVHDRHLIDGILLTLPALGAVAYGFAQEAANVTVHNMSNDIVQVMITTNPVDVGNTMAYVGPQSAITFGDYPNGFISMVTITDTNTLGRGGGPIIVNGYFN